MGGAESCSCRDDGAKNGSILAGIEQSIESLTSPRDTGDYDPEIHRPTNPFSGRFGVFCGDVGRMFGFYEDKLPPVQARSEVWRPLEAGHRGPQAPKAATQVERWRPMSSGVIGADATHGQLRNSMSRIGKTDPGK
eukprot:TRINITY_DN32012_c0_g1_i1.p1 TRINITY_DN32012_c0_g1~~TRINITY_DN32012_c0_g1_i1.p1  ORF type:complete len:136 (+),score=22.75 TRINITY_DN32012_c0_g1_i1:98-505(+)